MAKRLSPIHPGHILAEDLRDASIGLHRLAREIHFPVNRIRALVDGKRPITAGAAVRFSQFFGTTSQYWMNLQSNYDSALANFESGVRTLE